MAEQKTNSGNYFKYSTGFLNYRNCRGSKKNYFIKFDFVHEGYLNNHFTGPLKISYKSTVRFIFVYLFVQVNQSDQLKTYVRRLAGQSPSQGGLNSLHPRLRFRYKVNTNTISR